MGMPSQLPELLTRKEVLALVGFSRTTLHEMEKAGNFPKARKLHPTGRSVRYISSEIRSWIEKFSA